MWLKTPQQIKLGFGMRVTTYDNDNQLLSDEGPAPPPTHEDGTLEPTYFQWFPSR